MLKIEPDDSEAEKDQYKLKLAINNNPSFNIFDYVQKLLYSCLNCLPDCIKDRLVVFQDPEMSYLICLYFPITVCANFMDPNKGPNICYCLLLLDIVYRNATLKMIIKVF